MGGVTVAKTAHVWDRGLEREDDLSPFWAVVSDALRLDESVMAAPAIAARAAANLEFLAVSLPHDARYGSSPTVNQQMAAARREMHAALGIVEAANPQLVVNGLYAASRALAAGDNAAAERALAPAVFSNGGETLRRLAAMGPWPRTAEATAMAEREHLRIEQERINSQPGGDSSGRN